MKNPAVWRKWRCAFVVENKNGERWWKLSENERIYVRSAIDISK
jgi:hypothetical protein